VRGEPGIGKTTLLRYAIGRAEGMRVLRARGVETEAELPFAGLHELLQPVVDLIGEIPESQAAVLRGALALGPPVEARLRIGAGTLSMLSADATAGGRSRRRSRSSTTLSSRRRGSSGSRARSR
jgi:hypothetical protein